MANDLAWMGSGPRAGLAEFYLPELRKGSSMVSGKVWSVICEVVLQVGAQVIGNDMAITVGGENRRATSSRTSGCPWSARNLLKRTRSAS